MEVSKRGLLMVVLVGLGGCSAPPHLADGPLNLEEVPTVTRFERPVRSVGPIWELCFEFDIPGDSHEVGRIHAALVATTGQRYGLEKSVLDRRGEAVVCRIGQPRPIAPADPTSTAPEPIEYEGVELSSDVPLTLRALRGGSRPR